MPAPRLFLPELIRVARRGGLVCVPAMPDRGFGVWQGLDHATAMHAISANGRETLKAAAKAEKLIFDSGTDNDPENSRAVHDAASEMMHFGLFRLPHPTCWIEDPFRTPDGRELEGAGFERMAYLCTEQGNIVIAQPFARALDGRWCWWPTCSALPLDGSTGSGHHVGYWLGLGDRDVRWSDSEADLEPMARSAVAATIFAIKKLVVTLATGQALQDRVPVPWHLKAKRRGGDQTAAKAFAFTYIRLPDWAPSAPTGAGARPCRHLVRGYVYGRHTLPREKQRWVAPYWRGDASLGVGRREAYTVKGKAA